MQLRSILTYFLTSMLLTLGCQFADAGPTQFRDQWLCRDENFIRYLQSPGRSQNIGNFEWFKPGDPKLLVFGDVHFVSDPLVLAKIFEAAKNAMQEKKSCLLLELSQDPVGIIRDFKYILTRPKNEEVARNVGQILNYFEPVISSATNHKMKIYGVDVDVADNVPDDEAMAIRNRQMASNIQKLLKSGDCDSAIFMVGKGHILSTSRTPKTSNVTQEMRHLGIAFTTFNLQNTRDEHWGEWSGCQPDWHIPRIFKNDFISPNTELFTWPSYGKWGDFDFTILLH